MIKNVTAVKREKHSSSSKVNQARESPPPFPCKKFPIIYLLEFAKTEFKRVQVTFLNLIR